MVNAIDLAGAREAVRKAKRPLKNAEYRFDTDCGPENSDWLIAEIKKTERRLAEASAKLRDLDTRNGGRERGLKTALRSTL